jgi:hypothetical protein
MDLGLSLLSRSNEKEGSKIKIITASGNYYEVVCTINQDIVVRWKDDNHYKGYQVFEFCQINNLAIGESFVFNGRDRYAKPETMLERIERVSTPVREIIFN